MALPGNMSLVWVRGTFLNLDGSAMTGRITFSANVVGGALVNPTAKRIIGASPFSGTLDAATGYFQVQLPATNDPDVTPVGFTYSVVEPTGRKYSITVPFDAPALDSPGDPLHGQQVIELSDIVPAPGASGGTAQLLRGRGVASMDVDGTNHLVVTYSDATTEDLGVLPGGALANMSDLDTTGAAVGQVPAVTAVSGGVATGFGLLDLSATPEIRSSLRPTSARVAPAHSMLAQANTAGHGWIVGNGSTGTVTMDDTAYAPLGTQSIRMVTNGAGGGCRVDRTGLTLDMTGKQPVVWVTVDDPANLANLVLYLSDAGFTNFYQWDVESGSTAAKASRFTRAGKFTKVTLPWSAAFVTGSPNRAALTTIRIGCADYNATPVTVHLSGVGAQPEAAPYPNGVCTFSFDDGWATQLLAQQSLDRYGLPATAYPIVDLVGTPSYLTLAQLKALRDNSGWEIASHAYTAAAHNAVGGFTALTPEQLEAEYVGMRRWSALHGFRGLDHLAYPQGFHNDTVLDLSRQYFTSARTTYQVNKETWPPADPYRIRTRMLDSGTSLAQAMAYLDTAKASRGWIIFSGHKLGSPTDSLTWAPADFDALVDYAVTQGIAVRTVGAALLGQ